MIGVFPVRSRIAPARSPMACEAVPHVSLFPDAHGIMSRRPVGIDPRARGTATPAPCSEPADECATLGQPNFLVLVLARRQDHHSLPRATPKYCLRFDSLACRATKRSASSFR